MDLLLLLQHGLIYGLILSAALSVTFTGLMLLNPEIWLHDYPPDIQAKYGPISERARRQKALAVWPVALLLIGLVIASLLGLAQLNGGVLAFADAFVGTFVMLMVFNLIDLLLLDWLIFVTIRPRLIVLPGTEGLAGYRDYGFHFRGFLKGTAGSLVASLVVAVIAAGLAALR